MKIRKLDAVEYRKKQKKVAITLSLIFALLGLGLSALLRHFSGNPEGENMLVNLIGVLSGLLITISIYSRYKSHPYLEDIGYIWGMKKKVLNIQNKIHHWEEALQRGEQTAATVLAFYFEAGMELQRLENNEYGSSEMVKRYNRFQSECERLGLIASAEDFEEELLGQF